MSNNWKIGKLEIKRSADDKVKLIIDGKEAEVMTEDLATVVRQELPADRAQQLFSEIETEIVSKGKARVVVVAHKDIKKGDEVCFTFDVTRYLDSVNKNNFKQAYAGLRMTQSGILY